MRATARYARENNMPYFGICLGMQIAGIEYARNVCGLTDANSGEFAPGSQNKVIDFMPGQSDDIDKGGTLRLGSYPCDVLPGTTPVSYTHLQGLLSVYGRLLRICRRMGKPLEIHHRS